MKKLIYLLLLVSAAQAQSQKIFISDQNGNPKGSPLSAPFTLDGTFTLLIATNTGTDGQVLSLTGNAGKWITPATGGAGVYSNQTVTVAGTANQITSSAGAQDLSVSRTWTLTTPQDIGTASLVRHGSLGIGDSAALGTLVVNDTVNGNLLISSNGTVYLTTSNNTAIPTGGLIISNATVATSGNPKPIKIYDSYAQGYGTTASSNTVVRTTLNLFPTSGTTAGYNLIWSNSVGGAAFVQGLLMTQAGRATASSIYAGNGTITAFRFVGDLSANGAGGGSQLELGTDGFVTIYRNSLDQVSGLRLGGVGAGFPALYTTNNNGIEIRSGAGNFLTNCTAKTFSATNVTFLLGGVMTIPSGTNQRAGNATLVAGTITVNNTTVTANTVVLLTRKTSGGTTGELTYTLSAGTSFTINSIVTDTSTISYLLVEVP